MEENERRFQLRKIGKGFKANNSLWRKKKKEKKNNKKKQRRRATSSFIRQAAHSIIQSLLFPVTDF
jgi:hypothetical protein